MHGWMHACMHICMYIIYIYIYTLGMKHGPWTIDYVDLHLLKLVIFQVRLTSKIGRPLDWGRNHDELVTVNTNFARNNAMQLIKWSLEIVPFIFIIYLSYYCCHHILYTMKLPFTNEYSTLLFFNIAMENSPFSSMTYHDVPIANGHVP